METKYLAVFGLLGAVALYGCDGGDDDSAGGDDEADADTDADTDADSDADSDADADADTDADTDPTWDADTMQFVTDFTWDASAGTFVTLNANGKKYTPLAAVSLYNYDNVNNDPEPDVCSIVWDISGAPTDSGSFDKDYWLDVALSGAPVIETSGCENLVSFVTVPVDGTDPEAFFDSFEWAFGLTHIDNIPSKHVEVWESFWAKGYEKNSGSWEDNEEFFAGSSFANTWTATDVAPYGLVQAYQVNPKTWELITDGDGNLIPISLETATSAPTAYYGAFTMYVYGTGFN